MASSQVTVGSQAGDGAVEYICGNFVVTKWETSRQTKGKDSDNTPVCDGKSIQPEGR